MAEIIKFVYVMILFLFLFLVAAEDIGGNCECIRDEDCFKQKRDEDCHKEYCMIFYVHKCENYKCVCAGMFN
ncbi:putative Late nodulin [Medicago truncatula]|uniref:Nodule Cysteine-Rich (NCR) secreted peptide n=1 Tax=Medicago truncatula TaxID=3880 RepID=G7K5W8_MEDTR|nr:Nodule Cysteine-Rich (NCR) secreted peptide [Medicago truncatula]RHN56778.1 putative Late nodulin [Medicago truncatula]